MPLFAHVYSECFGCQKLFAYNPRHVPSIRINGERQPVCRDCVEQCNPARIKNGLPPIVLHPDAYEPCSEEDLP
jgi:hypothetical protein